MDLKTENQKTFEVFRFLDSQKIQKDFLRIKANCTNCHYVAYLHTDGIRYERCRIRKKYKSVPINPLALKSIEEWSDLRGPIDLCERHLKSDKLEIEVYY